MTRSAAVIAALIACVSLWLLPARALAQQAPSIDSAMLSPSTATIGDHLTMTVAVLHDDAFSIEGPGFGDSFGDFELLEVAEPRRVAEGGADRSAAHCVAEGGADRTGANRIAENGSERSQSLRVAEGGSDRTNGFRVAEGGADRTDANRIG